MFPVDLADLFASMDDLSEVTKAVARETVIREAMAQTGEGRSTVADMIDAAQSMGQEAVLELTDGEPTTLRDALSRYVDEAETRRGGWWPQVAEELTAILNYPWRDEESLIQLHNPHYGLALHVDTAPDGSFVEIKMGNNRHTVAVVYEQDSRGVLSIAEQVAQAVYRATLVRVIADREHHVQLSSADRRSLLAWLERPNGSWASDSGGRVTVDAVGGGGVLVRTRPYSYQTIPRTEVNR